MMSMSRKRHKTFLDALPYKVSVSVDNSLPWDLRQEMDEWNRENTPDIWKSMHLGANGSHYHFRKEADAMAFKLRWM